MLSKLGVPGLCGITLGLALGILNQSGTTAQAFDPAAVQCYSAASLQAQTNGSSASDLTPAALSSAHEALSAIQACSPAKCDEAQTAKMKSALTSYLSLRRTVTSDLYHKHGASGLETAAHIFTAADDVRLAQSLAQLYAAGKLDFKALGAEREALALAALKPANAFRPCDAVAKPVKGYVF